MVNFNKYYDDTLCLDCHLHKYICFLFPLKQVIPSWVRFCLHHYNRGNFGRDSSLLDKEALYVHKVGNLGKMPKREIKKQALCLCMGNIGYISASHFYITFNSNSNWLLWRLISINRQILRRNWLIQCAKLESKGKDQHRGNSLGYIGIMVDLLMSNLQKMFIVRKKTVCYQSWPRFKNKMAPTSISFITKNNWKNKSAEFLSFFFCLLPLWVIYWGILITERYMLYTNKIGHFKFYIPQRYDGTLKETFIKPRNKI